MPPDLTGKDAPLGDLPNVEGASYPQVPNHEVTFLLMFAHFTPIFMQSIGTDSTTRRLRDVYRV